MNQLKFFIGSESKLPTQIQAGALYHCEDTGNTYLGKEHNELKLYSTTLTLAEAKAASFLYTDAEILEWVGDKKVSEQINELSTIINTKLDGKSQVQIITWEGDD